MTIRKIHFETEMQKSYLDYAMSVIMSRAIPDVRDGLKPVHRRILYAMIVADYHHNKPYRKSSRVVGEVLGKYHPHSDDAIYDSIVKMAQSFYMNVPLIDGQGNFGSIDGDKAAASRYTEVRLTKAAHYMLNEYNMQTVDYIPNYDNSTEIAAVLPARFPNILINGSSGIAVGMATNIPCHNLKEVMHACVYLLDHDDADLEGIMQYIKGPDFNSECTILVSENLIKGYETGRGYFKIRAKHKIEELEGKDAIIFQSIPYQVNKTTVIETILELMKNKTIETIADIRDESDRQGIRLVVFLKKGSNVLVTLNKLYSYTNLQTNFHINNLVINGLQPMQMSLLDTLKAFLTFRKEVIIRRTKYLLEKYQKKVDDLIAMNITVNNIDKVINILSEAKSAKEARMNLQVWNNTLSEDQVKIILDMRLNKLTSLEKEKIEHDLSDMKSKIQINSSILNNNDELLTVMRNEFNEIIDEFGKDRTTIIEEDIESNIEELIEREDIVITVSKHGYIKRVPISEYRIQNRGGKGRSGMKTKNEDSVAHIFFANTHTKLLFFTSSGNVFQLKAYHIPCGSVSNRGSFVRNVISFDETESLNTILIVPEENIENWNIIFATSRGIVKKNRLLDFQKIKRNGKIAIKMQESEYLVQVALCTENDDILLTSNSGLSVRFSSTKIRLFIGRNSAGVHGMNLGENAKIVSMLIIKQDEYPTILTISENGIGKRTKIITSSMHRGGKGKLIMQINKKTGKLIAAILVTLEDTILILTNAGNVIRCNVSDIKKLLGRRTQGVKIVTLEKNDHVVSIDKISSSQLI